MRLLVVLILLVFAAPARALDLTLIHTWDGTVAHGLFGDAITVVGDMDGDGWPEFAIGARADSTGGAGAGRVFIYRGGPHWSEPPALVITGLPGDLLGTSLAAAGDLDGDGRADLVIGAPAGTNLSPGSAGRVVIVYGATPLGARANVSIAGVEPAGHFGAAVAGLGPFEGGAFPDFAVGAPDANSGAGLVRVYHGGASGPTLAFTLHGRNPDDAFGAAITGAGRTRGGPTADLLVGAPFNSDAALWGGRAYLYLGGTPPDTIPDRAYASAGDGDLMGDALAGLGDVNGDGRDDFAIAAPEANTGPLYDTGRVSIYLGSAPPPLASTLTISGTTAYAELGLAMAGIGDVDGDGRADFALGAPGAPDTNQVGLVEVFRGGATLSTTPDTTYTGQASDDMFGHSLSNGGRVLGGTRDVFFAGSGEHAGGLGRAYLYASASAVSVPNASFTPGVRLEPVWPSPSAGQVRLACALSAPSDVTLQVIDVCGRAVAHLASGVIGSGRHEWSWTSDRPGLYWAVLVINGSASSRHFVILGR